DVSKPHARQVLILVPGWFEAAGLYKSLALELVSALPSTEVWVFDRSEQRLEDLSHFDLIQHSAAAYYLGGAFVRPAPAKFDVDATLGLTSTLDDLRQVVQKAGDNGRRRVVLGGHSWGATLALLFAGWDFNGNPGFRDLRGLVLIDGGVHGAF